MPTELTNKGIKDMPHEKLIVYKGGGHLPAEEIPIKSAKDLHEFLSQPKGPSSQELINI